MFPDRVVDFAKTFPIEWLRSVPFSLLIVPPDRVVARSSFFFKFEKVIVIRLFCRNMIKQGGRNFVWLGLLKYE